ncbi:MAG: hypothetical protein ACRESE_07255 [Gammaproteobacteria bacterium]
MRTHWLAVLFGVFAALMMFSAHADPGDTGYSNTHFTVDAGIAGGSDKLATVTFTNGDTKSIYAGNAVYGDLGFLTNFGASHWSFNGTLGYAYTAVVASNATISFSRFPLDVIGIYNLGRNHFGAGITY